MAEKKSESKNDEIQKQNEKPKEEIDEEFDELLNSALKDFDKPSFPNPSNESKSEETEPVSQEDDALWGEEFMQQSKAEFENLLQNLVGQDPNAMEEFKKFAAMAGKAGDGDGDGEPACFSQDFFLANLSATAQAFSNQNASTFSDEDLSKVFRNLGLNPPAGGETSDMASVVQNMMQMLLSKDLLYPALKDITAKYPTWLAENKATLETEQYDKYVIQFDLMTKICREFENEGEGDTEEEKRTRFERILDWMQKMQECGNPPTALIGENSGFEIDENGIPKFPGLGANEKCRLM